MQTSFGLACAIARDNAGFTQEQAEILLCVSVRSISDYERDHTIPSDDVVERMMQSYNAPWLGYIYLKSTNRVACQILPDIELRQLSASILDLQVEMNHVNAAQIEIAEVGRDNNVDENERPRWQRCTSELRGLVGSIFSVLMAPAQKEKTSVLAHRRLA